MTDAMILSSITTIPGLRNHQYLAQTNAELDHLRAHKWQAYAPDDPVGLSILGETFRFRPGLTFTPFANAVRCNAHCAFCSEELVRKDGHQPTALRLIGDHDAYFEALEAALEVVQTLPMGLSLSGLEATAEPRWLLRLLELLDRFPDAFDERVLYTNGSGLGLYPELIGRLAASGFDRIELSRCHQDEVRNQQIMRFNRNLPVYRNEGYTAMLAATQAQLFVRNSCILTRGGVDSLPTMEAYLDWAMDLGVQQVVFRELSRLGDAYQDNRTSTWVEDHRIPIEPLLHELAPDHSGVREDWAYLHSTVGYYYYNEHFRYRDQVEVIIETSSYPALMKANAQDVIQKLVFHSNGNLCGDWDADSTVIGRFLSPSPHTTHE